MNCKPLWTTALVLLVASSAVARDELQQQATWKAPTPQEVRADLQLWLESQQLDEAQKLQVETLWPPEFQGEFDLIDRLAAVLSVVNEGAREIVAKCEKPRSQPRLPEFPLLDDENVAPLVRNNLRLLYGRWLSQNGLYDEALEQLDKLDTNSVIDPAALLFYQGIAHHRLLHKKQCLPVLQRLLENEGQIPRRYLTLAQLMEADIEPLKPDSLDEIARLMENVRRRLGMGRAGKRVRKEEDDIVAKLDKMIEEMEEQQKKQQQGGAGGQLQPSQPMQDSNIGGGSGPGEVDQRSIGNSSGWGNLPPQQRQEILQEITKDLPAHFRNVIEEYFRRLARESR